MQVLFDTSVLVAAFVSSHPRHLAASTWFERIDSSNMTLVVAAHSLIECYAVLTRLPLSPKILPGTAKFLIKENVEKIANIITLSEADYFAILSDMADLGLSGGIIYDALILKAAQKAKVEKLLTFNVNDFQMLCPESKQIIESP